jgi:hypothetical protein
MQLASLTAHMASGQGSAGVTLSVLPLETAAQHVQITTVTAAKISRQHPVQCLLWSNR